MDIIEHLKDKTQAQPFGLRTEEGQKALLKAGIAHCLWLNRYNVWKQAAEILAHGTTYVLKPDYQPEPEYVDIQIIQYSHWLRLKDPLSRTTSCRRLDQAVQYIDFVGFYTFHNNHYSSISLCDVSHNVREGKKVVARFVKESKCTNP